MSIRFLLDGEVITLDDPDPTATLLDHLRYRMRRTGSKEGCAEGDCGACTVLLGELSVPQDAVAWRAVNACILFLPMLHGKALLTVESLGSVENLNPLQACMAANGSSQCGFCTPGFVMSLYGRCIGASGHDLPVEDVLAGNLCRCTGYGPILRAGEEVARLSRDDAATLATLRMLAREPRPSGIHEGRRWFFPNSADELGELLTAVPDARMVAGATDVGLWVTKGLKRIDNLIFVGDIPDLREMEESEGGLKLGAAVRFAEAHGALARLHPDMGELIRRIGALQVRNAGTVGGNIANGSPIGDTPPALIALGAEVVLRSAADRRTMALEDYFIDYGLQDRRPWEFVESIHVPRPKAHHIVHISKLSRRFDSDISAVCGAIRLSVIDTRIVDARVAFGGMAATPRRARACEAALLGEPFDQPTIERAAAALVEDFSPLTDVRGTSAYRTQAAANIIRRMWYRAQDQASDLLTLEACRD